MEQNYNLLLEAYALQAKQLVSYQIELTKKSMENEALKKELEELKGDKNGTK